MNPGLPIQIVQEPPKPRYEIRIARGGHGWQIWDRENQYVIYMNRKNPFTNYDAAKSMLRELNRA